MLHDCVALAYKGEGSCLKCVRGRRTIFIFRDEIPHQLKKNVAIILTERAKMLRLKNHTQWNEIIWNHSQPRRKILKFHLISWCGNFMETHSFNRVSSDSSETLWNLYVSSKCPHQEIRWNYGILCSKLYVVY